MSKNYWDGKTTVWILNTGIFMKTDDELKKSCSILSCEAPSEPAGVLACLPASLAHRPLLPAVTQTTAATMADESQAHNWKRFLIFDNEYSHFHSHCLEGMLQSSGGLPFFTSAFQNQKLAKPGRAYYKTNQFNSFHPEYYVDKKNINW